VTTFVTKRRLAGNFSEYKIIDYVRVFMYSYLRVDKIKTTGKQITLNYNN
jgi:hypothetical protein